MAARRQLADSQAQAQQAAAAARLHDEKVAEIQAGTARAIQAIAYALANNPDALFVFDVKTILRQVKEFELTVQVPPEISQSLRHEPRLAVYLVAVPADAVKRSESRIILPGEIR